MSSIFKVTNVVDCSQEGFSLVEGSIQQPTAALRSDLHAVVRAPLLA